MDAVRICFGGVWEIWFCGEGSAEDLDILLPGSQIRSVEVRRKPSREKWDRERTGWQTDLEVLSSSLSDETHIV